MAQYTRNEQLLHEKNQTLEQKISQQQHSFKEQQLQQTQTLQAYEIRVSQTDMQLLQTQTELRLTQQQLAHCLQENSLLKTQTLPNNKREALRAKLKR